MRTERWVVFVVSGVAKSTFGALPNLPLTLTASDADPGEAQDSGVAAGDGAALAAGLDAALDAALEELLALGLDDVQPTSASGTAATARAARRSGRRVGEGIRPS
jgi:hypothetical protein